MPRIVLLVSILIMVSFTLSGAIAGEKDDRASDCLEKSCFDGKNFTRAQVEGNELVKKFCTTCHTESRIFNKLKELHADRDVDYEKDVKSIVVKKIRLTGGSISHKDGKKILEYLVTL